MEAGAKNRSNLDTEIFLHFFVGLSINELWLFAWMDGWMDDGNFVERNGLGGWVLVDVAHPAYFKYFNVHSA